MPIFNSSELKKIVDASAFRKADAELRYNYFHDMQAERLYNEISQNWKEPDDFPLLYVNIVHKIVTNLAMTYKHAPLRNFNNDVAEDVYKNMQVNRVLKKGNRYTKLFKTCMLQPRWINERLTLHVITPNIIDVVYTDPHYPEIVILTNISSDVTKTTYSVWTESAYELYDSRGRQIVNPANPDNVNPYGILPFVPTFDAEPDDSFFLMGGTDIIDAQTEINKQLSNLFRNIEYQAHGQPVITGLDEDDAISRGGRIALSPKNIVTLPQNAQFDFKSPDAPIEEVLKAIEFIIKQTAQVNGLSPSLFDLDPVAESGVAKLMEQQDLIESRQDDLDLWRSYESRLYKVIRAVWNVHNPDTQIPESEFSVDFSDLVVNVSEKEQLQNLQTEVDLGIKSPVDVYMARNPDIRDRKQAIEHLEMVRQENEQFGTALDLAGMIRTEN